MDRLSVYKILGSADLEAARLRSDWLGTALDLQDGFVHLSSASQVAGTLAAHFRGHGDLALLRFAADGWGPALRWEASRNGELFPHLYGALDVTRALDVWPISVDPTGACALPDLPA